LVASDIVIVSRMHVDVRRVSVDLSAHNALKQDLGISVRYAVVCHAREPIMASMARRRIRSFDVLC